MPTLVFHRRWAGFLPEEVQRKVLLENAVALFRPMDVAVDTLGDGSAAD